MKVSIIVPVYNTENYLKTCFDSLAGQTYSNLEILLVDDGSRDDSGRICDDYARRDSRFSVIHQENQGQSLARNAALACCSGEYVTFVDSDDSLPLDAVEKLVKPLSAKRYDVVCGLFENRCSGRSIPMKLPFESGEVSRQDAKRWHSFKTDSLFGYSCGKLYRRDFLEKHDITFDDIRKVYMEDTLFNLKVWVYEPAFMICDAIVYEYYRHEDTSSSRKMPGMEYKCVASLETYLAYLHKHGEPDRQKDLLIPLIARMSSWAVIYNIPFEGVSFQRIRERIKCFSRNSKIREILKSKGAIGQLWHLPSFPQRIFYMFSLYCMKWKMEWLPGLVYLAGYPLMKIYADHVLGRA